METFYVAKVSIKYFSIAAYFFDEWQWGLCRAPGDWVAAIAIFEKTIRYEKAI